VTDAADFRHQSQIQQEVPMTESSFRLFALMIMFPVLLVLALAVAVVGCGQPTPTPSPPPLLATPRS
jgi:hypothetical protein